MDWGDWLGVVGTVSHMGGHSWLPMWQVVDVVLFTRVTLPPLWIADQVRNDGGGAGSRVGCYVA